MSVFDNLSFPVMNSRTKAAHVKPLIHFLAFKSNSVLGERPEDSDAELRAVAIWGLADMMYVFDTSEPLLSDSQVSRARRSGYAYLNAWASLASKANLEGRAAYKLRPKMHYLDHLLERLETRENPRFFSNFADEDFMGRVVAIARRQHRSVCVPRTLATYIMHRRRRWRRATGGAK